MSIARVQNKELQGSLSSGSTIAFTSNVTAGNLLVLLAGQQSPNNRPITAVSDNLNGAWTQAVVVGTAGSTRQAEVWYRKNSLGGACTVTLTWSNGTDTKDFQAIEYSGCDTTAPLDVTDSILGASSTNNQYATNSDTTSANGAVTLGVSALNGSDAGWTSTSGFTQITSTNTSITFAERIDAGSITTNGSYTLSTARSFSAVMVSFKAAGGAAARQQSLTLTGCGV